MDEHREVAAARAAGDRTEEIAAVAERLKIAERRIQRFQDLLVNALEESDPLRANLRAATADLLEIGYRLGTAVKVALDSESASSERYEEMMPAIGAMALIHRQATRYVELDRDWNVEPDLGRKSERGRPRLKNETGEIKN